MTQVIDSAGDRFDTLRLRTNNEAAVRLYIAMGFRAFTAAAECTHILELARRSG
jgi:ribosomal protein S18 acetylase RimI-like enzyme